MSLGDAGKLVSDFWMSYMIGMWSFSFILRFFDLQRILTVLAGLATVLMYLFINGSPEHMPWFILTTGLLLQRHLHLDHYARFAADAGRFAEAGELYPHLRHHRHHAHFRGHRPDCGGQRSPAALHTANGLYAVVFVMCFILGFVSRHRQNNAQAASH